MERGMGRKEAAGISQLRRLVKALQPAGTGDVL